MEELGAHEPLSEQFPTPNLFPLADESRLFEKISISGAKALKADLLWPLSDERSHLLTIFDGVNGLDGCRPLAEKKFFSSFSEPFHATALKALRS